MRLLNTETLKLEEYFVNIPEYAILSHRWEQEEVTYQDLQRECGTGLKGWQKLEACCRVAAARGFSYAWIDTCCIDKSSSSELSEAINSMYLWYQQSSECYVYMSDTHTDQLSTAEGTHDFASSLWFTRGWTLQELIAPKSVFFFNHQWSLLGSKSKHSLLLAFVTNIDVRLLRGEADLSHYSIAQRMSWAANRHTTRLEDEAYCLLGIFGVNMPMLYGDGKNAFRRLQEEIIKQSDDQTLFAWHDDRPEKPILAPSPACFSGLHDLRCIYATNDSRHGHSLSNAGLDISLMLIPWDMNLYLAPLSCGRILSNGSPNAKCIRGYSRLGIFLRKTKYENHLVRVSFRGQDFVMLNSDEVARTRDRLRLRDRRVFLRQTTNIECSSIFYGFEFSFKHPLMFVAGARPIPSEVTSAYIWNPHQEVLVAQTQRPSCIVGFFNLHGLEPLGEKIYLHLGFDLNFAPACLITTSPPDSSPETMDGDLTTILSDTSSPTDQSTQGGRVGPPSLAWFLNKIDEGTSKETFVAFRGTPEASAIIICPRLGLRIALDLKYSATFRKNVWVVGFDAIPQMPPSLAPDAPSGQEPFVKLSAPLHVAQVAKPTVKSFWSHVTGAVLRPKQQSARKNLVTPAASAVVDLISPLHQTQVGPIFHPDQRVNLTESLKKTQIFSKKAHSEVHEPYELPSPSVPDRPSLPFDPPTIVLEGLPRLVTVP